MANVKDLRKRISSVKNTQQITRAMKMVSAAKLRRAQENILKLRPYALELNKVLATLAQYTGTELSHPLLDGREISGQKNVLIIIFTSDRGLCGSFNGSIIKATQRFLKEQGSNYKKLDLAFIGKRGFDYFKNRKSGKFYQEFYKDLNFNKVQVLSNEWIEKYSSGEYDEIRLIYNEFKSALSQKVVLDTFLPVTPSNETAPENKVGAGVTIYEPSPEKILDELLPKYFATKIYRALLESLASEHGARMAAMENATKNAGEMIRKLTLLYNKTRQAGITKELLEITSGTEAQK